MDEYTFENLIINPETPGLEDLIGKEVYFNDIPIYCIKQANDDYKVGILTEIRKDYSAPFFVETPSGCMLNYACIIPKKEDPKPKYIPFESVNEFIDAYDYCVNYRISRGSVEDKLLNCSGILLRRKEDDAMCMVIEIRKDGIVLGSGQSLVKWGELLEGYVFIDGSPCGRLVEEKHE